jgi:hypothetical protein
VKRIAFAVALSICALTGSARAEEAKQDFALVNKTGYDIKHVYVSPAKSDDWEEDVLGKDTLDDGDAWDIKFHRASKTCKWDLKVVYEVDSTSAVWSDIDLCKIEKITIRYNKDTDKTSAVFD